MALEGRAGFAEQYRRMELAIIILVGVLFTLLGVACIVLLILGLPGTWFIIALAVLINLIDPLYLSDDHARTFNWWLIGFCVLLAALGEVFELIAGVLGAKRSGGTNRGMWGALIGGVVGAIALIALLPPFGPLIGAVAGTFAGAIVGETTAREAMTVRQSIRPATGATIGRILGTLSKLPIAVAVWAALSIAAFLP
jgi:uncharacterized protein YqgC (DUF456 family)